MIARRGGSSRLAVVWRRVRDSLWFAPSLGVVLGVVLAVLAVELPIPTPDGSLAAIWLFTGGAEGARGVLTAIAGSLITVTGTVFSVTIVALQLASSQFTPRVLRSFVADRVNQVVLAIFIGTFTYTLLVLRTIHSESQDRTAFVPQLGVTVALVLLLLSVGALIVFINHTAQSIRASVILARETARGLAVVGGRRDAGRPDDEAARVAPELPDSPGRAVPASGAGYLQTVHLPSLWRLDERDAPGGGAGAPLAIRLERRVGSFVLPGMALASVWPAGASDQQLDDAIRAACILGPERTPDQDVEFSLLAISDIAVRALSPGVNDPTTAIHCIDRLAELLAAMASLPDDPTWRGSPSGRVHLLMPGTTFTRALAIAFDQVRHFGASNPAVARRLVDAARELAVVVPPAARGALVDTADAVLRQARREIEDAWDLAAVEAAVAALRASAATPGTNVAAGDSGP